jgi:DNA/RNA endonuclease G (NUC1)
VKPLRSKYHLLALIVCLTLTGLLAAGARPAPVTIATLAPDSNTWHMGDFLIGAPDFTGNPRYTIQELKYENLVGPGDRAKSHWMRDPRALRERPIGDADYKNNPLAEDLVAHPQGIARFHFVCAADQSQTQEATDDTHHMSNCTPADQMMNAQSWERSEKRGRDLILLAHKLKLKVRVFEITVPLYVLTKPEDAHHAWVGTFNAIGKNCVWYPSHFGKTYYVIWSDRTWMETYVFENSSSVAGDNILAHLSSLDVIEFQTNLNFCPKVPNEDELEAGTEAPPTLDELETAA